MITLTAEITLNNGEKILINKRNLLSLEHSIFDRDDLKSPEFGIISNVGNFKINDTDGVILTYAESGLFEKGLKCEIFLNNTLANYSTKIGVFETDEWDYDSENFVVNVSIKDDLEEWQEINIEGINCDPSNPTATPLSDIYTHLWEKTNANYPMKSLEELDDLTKSVLTNTYLKYPLLEKGTLWQQWTKLCQVSQLHIYKNNEGIVSCRYNGGN
jgi:hypothetical protein